MSKVKVEPKPSASSDLANFEVMQGRAEQRTEVGLAPSEGAVASPNEAVPKISKSPIIFFGNGPLADAALSVLAQHTEIIFHARTQDDLAEVIRLKKAHPEAYGVLASFGVLIKRDVLDLFEPEGILNLHPSKLPEYRGASPIETAILDGAKDFSYSIMKLVKAMDAGPLYHQDTLEHLPLDKQTIYHELATAGANWICTHLAEIRSLTPTPQDGSQATFTTKLTKDLSWLHPDQFTAAEIHRQIVAYQWFPKPKYQFFGKNCIILAAHVLRVTDILCEAAGIEGPNSSPLMIKCADRNFVVIDRLQPEGKKPMDAKSFMNGYGKNH